MCFTIHDKLLCCYAPLCNRCYKFVLLKVGGIAIAESVAVHAACVEPVDYCLRCNRIWIDVFWCKRDCLANLLVLRVGSIK